MVTKYATEWRFSILSLTPLILFFLILASLINTKQSPSLKFPLLFHNQTHDDKEERIAVCLVGGARRFELTGPSIIKNLLEEYPNADLFLHAPLDKDSYKFSMLKSAPRIAAVKVFVPEYVNETAAMARVLTSNNSPNGIQGLLQYFNLVEGCLNLITAHENAHNFTYDWIVRTRVDTYWSGPFSTDMFKPNSYVVPEGSSYDGLNDRLGVGDRLTSAIALSRLSAITKLDAAGHQGLNSESAFKAQLNVSGVEGKEMRVPFCVVSDRQYVFPPSGFGVPVASMNSKGPLSGAKCRPCTPVCSDQCTSNVMKTLYKNWSWTEYSNGTLSLCDASGEWEKGWEKIFDGLAGEAVAKERRRMRELDVEGCVKELKILRQRAEKWEAPALEKICRLGLEKPKGSVTLSS